MSENKHKMSDYFSSPNDIGEIVRNVAVKITETIDEEIGKRIIDPNCEVYRAIHFDICGKAVAMIVTALIYISFPNDRHQLICEESLELIKQMVIDMLAKKNSEDKGENDSDIYKKDICLKI